MKIFKNINNIYYPNTQIKPIEVFREMSSYEYFIIANSSFSALAAFLSEGNPKAILYPYPWWRLSEIEIKNIPGSWIPVKNTKN